MASKAKVDGREHSRKLRAVWKAGDILASDRYWQKWPDLFEQYDDSGEEVNEDGETED